MYYKSYTHEKKSLFNRLLSFILALCLAGSTLSSVAQTSPSNVCSYYVYDALTYGLRYKRVWVDSVLSFPFIADTVQNDTCRRPELYSLGPANLWWFDGARNYPILSGSGNYIDSAANGLQKLGQTVIEGYAGAAPNLFRSVLVKPGFNHTWGIGADSNYLGGSTDTLRGPYVGVATQSQFGTGPAFEAGYKTPGGAINNYYESDSQFIGPNFNLPDGANAFEEFGDRIYQVNVGAVGAGTYNWQWQPTVNTPALQSTIPGFWEVQMADSPGTTTETIFMDTNFRAQVAVAGSGSTQGIWMDHNNTFHVRRLAVDMDSIVHNSGGLTAIINSALGVPAGPSGYTIVGQDQAFVLTFTTGTVTPGVDSTDVAIQISFDYPAENNYIVHPMAYNSAAGSALVLMQPFIMNQTTTTFNLYGAVTNWSTVAFRSNTTYAIAFTTIDY
jgi:hypothetical protein